MLETMFILFCVNLYSEREILSCSLRERLEHEKFSSARQPASIRQTVC